MIPGSNLLATALTVIAPFTVEYFKFLERNVNDIGVYVPIFDAPVLVKGSLQPVPRSTYVTYGLDFQKSYFTFYTRSNMIDIQRGVTGDRIVVNNTQTYVCESNTADWYQIDGWKSLLCVLINGEAG